MFQTQTTTTTAPGNGPSLADLFRPLTSTGGSVSPPSDLAQTSPSNASSGVTQPANVSGTGAPGTVTVEDLLAGSKHTEISSISGQSGQTGTAPAVGTPGASVNLGGMMQGEWVK